MKNFNLSLNRILIGLLMTAAPAFAQMKTSVEIPSGYAGLPMNAWDPYIFQEGSIQHLFFGNLFCKGADGSLSFSKNPADTIFCKGSVFAIAYGYRDLRKSNQFTFRKSPAFLPSANGWDNNYVETPSITKRKGTYYLAYSAWPKLPKDNKRYQIGIASLKSKHLSRDMMDETGLFSRVQETPLVPRGSDTVFNFDRENTQEPSLIYNSKLDRFEVFYVGIKSPTPLPGDDPLTAIESIKLGRLCFDVQFQKIPCSSDEKEASRLAFVNMPEVHFVNGRYVLFYSDMTDLKEGFPYAYQNVYSRTSADGITWSAPQSVVQISSTKLNESAGIQSPSFILKPSGELTVIYQGWGIFPSANCLLNGKRIMLPLSTGMCKQTSLVISKGHFTW